MGIENFGGYRSEKHRRIKRKVTGIVTVAVIALIGAYIIGVLTDDGEGYKLREDVISQNHMLKQQIEELSEENRRLKDELAQERAQTPTPDPDTRLSPRD